MSTSQRGHFKTDSVAGPASTAAAPQWGQCRAPMNIMPKQDGHATLASFDSQYWHCGESDEIAAPQLGQLRVCACMIVKEGPLAHSNFTTQAEVFCGKMLDELTTLVRCYRLPAQFGLVVARDLE